MWEATMASRPSEARELSRMAQVATEAALSRKALDVVILDLRGVATFADYFVLCSGSSDAHIEGITNGICEKMADEQYPIWHHEGGRHSEWVLLDYVDVVVHVFSRSAREFYALERLWSDAERTVVSDERADAVAEWDERRVGVDYADIFTAADDVEAWDEGDFDAEE
jgi:ribosome-associated protein